MRGTPDPVAGWLIPSGLLRRGRARRPAVGGVAWGGSCVAREDSQTKGPASCSYSLSHTTRAVREAGGGCCQPVATPSFLQEDVVVMLVSRRIKCLVEPEWERVRGMGAFALGRLGQQSAAIQTAGKRICCRWCSSAMRGPANRLAGLRPCPYEGRGELLIWFCMQRLCSCRPLWRALTCEHACCAGTTWHCRRRRIGGPCTPSETRCRVVEPCTTHRQRILLQNMLRHNILPCLKLLGVGLTVVLGGNEQVAVDLRVPD